MIVWLLIGALGVLFVVGGRGYGRRLKAINRTPTLRSDEVAAAVAGGGGPAEVSGAAGPGPKDVLHAPLSGEPCVWYRVQVLKRPRQRFGRRIPRLPEVVLDRTSRSLFMVQDVAGGVTVDPAQLSEIVGRPALDAHEKAGPVAPAGSFAARALALRSELTLVPGTRYRYREWTIPEGGSVYAIGRAAHGPAGPVIGGGEDGGLTVGMGTERDVVRRLRLRLLATYGGGGLMAVVGFGVAAVGLIAILVQ